MIPFSTDPVRFPAYYQHYKGTKYLVTACATHTETGEKLVVYRTDSAEPQFWTRPVSMFLEEVTLPDGSKTPRFKFLSWGSRFES